MTSFEGSDNEELGQLKATLSQLSTQLEINPTSSEHQELVHLREELTQLIQLKEEQLLQSRKAALSSPVQGLLATTSKESAATLDLPPTDQSVTAYWNVEDQDYEHWVGQRCSIPGWTSNGRFIRQNAVVSGLLRENEDPGVDIPTHARVFFAHPTRPNDVPCHEFIEHGCCQRGVRCHASHGKVVAIEDLGPWHEPDLTKYSREGQPCLVKDDCSPYGLWRHARLLHTDADSQTCVIEWGHAFAQSHQSSAKRKSYSDLEESVASVPMDAVHCLSDDENDEDDVNTAVSGDTSSSSSESEASDSEAGRINSFDNQSVPTSSGNVHGVFNRRSRVTFVPGGILSPGDVLKAIPCNDPVTTDGVPLTVSDSTDAIGAWEAHTRGIGSRLLSKLGYDGSSGLGSCGQGRKLPVALILEKFQIRPRKWNKRPTLDLLVRTDGEIKCRKRGKAKIKLEQPTKSDDLSSASVRTGMFDLLNTALNRSEDIGEITADTNKNSNSQTAYTRPQFTKLSDSATRLQSFKLGEEVERTLRKIHDVQQSIERNRNKDRIVAKQAEQRLRDLQAHLVKLRQSERALQNSRKKLEKDKKLRIF